MPEEPPAPFELAIPPAYRAYVFRRLNGQAFFAILPGLIALVPIALAGFKIARFEWWQLIGIPIAIIDWWGELRRLWRYTFRTDALELISLTKLETLWTWVEVRWSHDIIDSSKESDWRHLPALSITVAMKVHNYEFTTFRLVYQPEDEEIVRDQVLPFIFYYREKYSHDLKMRKRRWKVNEGPMELLANGT